MAFKYDGRGVKPWSGGGNVQPIPGGQYRLRIIDTKEGSTKKGDNKVTVDFKVVGGEYDGRKVPYHTVTFMGKNAEGEPLPGAGIAVHFLKTIGQPWEGEYSVDHSKWRGKELIAEVVEEEYEGKVRNKVSEVSAIDPNEAAKEKNDAIEEVPF